MIPNKILNQLEEIASSEDFSTRSAELVDSWISAGVGSEVIEPTLLFMENHSSIDFGMPGPLVHCMEKFYGAGYEKSLVESVSRHPTPHTIWMLNRLINGAKSPEAKQLLIATLEQAKQNTLADELTVQRIIHFLDKHSK